MSMRNKIGGIIENELGHAGLEYIADAILEALPDMIAPLVWDAGDGITASKEYLRATSFGGGIYWTMEGELSCSFDMDAFDGVSFNSDKEAQAAANTHHRAAIMAAFTGETTT
jgi:hypothetical protein